MSTLEIMTRNVYALAATKTLQAGAHILDIVNVLDAAVGSGYSESKLPSEFTVPVYVGIQRAVEATVSEAVKLGKVLAALGVGHTPVPLTPLRTEGDVPKGFITEAYRNDPNRLETVTTRPHLVREFMNVGGVIATIYPTKALDNPPEGMKFFQKALRENPDTLVDAPSSNFDTSLTGATYWIQDQEGMLKISFQAHQANTEEVLGRNWGVTIERTANDAPDTGRFGTIAQVIKDAGQDKDMLLERSRRIIAAKMSPNHT